MEAVVDVVDDVDRRACADTDRPGVLVLRHRLVGARDRRGGGQGVTSLELSDRRCAGAVRLDLRVGRDVGDGQGERAGDADAALAGAGGRLGVEAVLAVAGVVAHRGGEAQPVRVEERVRADDGRVGDRGERDRDRRADVQRARVDGGAARLRGRVRVRRRRESQRAAARDGQVVRELRRATGT